MDLYVSKDKDSDSRQLDEKYVNFQIGARGVGIIKKGVVNVVLIIKFIQCH